MSRRNNIVGSVVYPLAIGLEGWWDFSQRSSLFDAVSGGSNVTPGNRIARVEDLSGNSRHLTQATSGTRPLLSAAAQNGLDVAQFDGAQLLQHSTAATWKFMHDGTKMLSMLTVKIGINSDPNALMLLFGTNTGLVSANVGYGLAYDDRASVPRNNVLNNQIAKGVTGQPPVSNISADNAITPNTFGVITTLTDPSNGTGSLRSTLYNGAGTAIANNSNTFAVSAADPFGPLSLGSGPAGTFALIGNVGELIIAKGANATEANRLRLLAYAFDKWIAP